MKYIFPLLLLLTIVFPVNAEDWHLVKEKQNSKYYVDLNSIKKVLGTVEYIESGIYNRNQKFKSPPFNKSFRAYRANMNINCMKKLL